MASDSEHSVISLKDFLGIKSELVSKLAQQLEIEVSMSEFEKDLAAEEESDLWDGPVVDSKTVVKLSPMIEEATGVKIKPEWLRSGGYDSVEDAIADVMRQLELELISSGD
ncbi:MAG: hypothetical protein AB2770_03940 [Candidatus Thiodiazotropha taylori]